MANIQPSTIFFDLDETLIKNRRAVPELFQDVYAEFAAVIGEENRSHYFAALREHASTLWDRMFTYDRSPETLFAECFANAATDIGLLEDTAANSLGHNMLDQYTRLSSGNVSFQPGAVETLRNLRELGFTVGIITNGIEKIQLGKISTLGLSDEVDVVVVSAQARAHKPHLPVYTLALELAGCSASDAWLIGDHPTNDVAGAIRAGMRGVFYDPTGTRREHAFNELTEQPNHIISSLAQVLDLLDHRKFDHAEIKVPTP